MTDKNHHVCPVERAKTLDNRFRRWVQNPVKILKPYVKEGTTAVDFGCGPGFFTLDMAKMVGESGRVVAIDLQEEMLGKLERKIRGTKLEERVALHKCEENKIGLAEKVDFILAFYVVHEVPDQEAFFRELESILQPSGQILVVEPPFHVSKAAFAQTIEKAEKAGFKASSGPKIFISKTAVLKKTS